MKVLQKSRLGLALAMAVGGGAFLASIQAHAAPQNPNVPNGGLQAASTVVGAVDNTTPYVAHNGLGQALIAPYYTVRDDQRTAINIMNTSNSTLAVKVVIREGKYSRDALNFYILMSPYDAWSGFLSSTSGVPTLHRSTDEDSCVVGAFGRVSGNVFTAMAETTQQLKTDGLVDKTDTDTLNEGYITVIAAGKVDTSYASAVNTLGSVALVKKGSNFAGYIKHGSNGKPADCQKAALVMTSGDGPITDITNRTNLTGKAELDKYFLGLAPGDNPLKGNVTILDAGDGIAGGTAMTAIANFNQNVAGAEAAVGNVLSPVTASSEIRAAETRGDLVTAQNNPYFYEPTLASGQGICTSSGLTQVEDAMRANSLINEWAYNPSTNAETDWVVTFPTKGFRTDPSGSNPAALGFCKATVLATAGTATTQYDNNGTPGATALAPSPTPRANGLPIYYTMGAVDREEKMPVTAPIPSPSTNNQPFFPYEVNVISFKPVGQKGPLSSNLNINADLHGMINGTPNGWAELKFNASATAGAATSRRIAGSVTTPDIAALGFMYKVRKQPGSASTNFGQIIDHSATQSSILAVPATFTTATVPGVNIAGLSNSAVTALANKLAQAAAQAASERDTALLAAINAKLAALAAAYPGNPAAQQALASGKAAEAGTKVPGASG